MNSNFTTFKEKLPKGTRNYSQDLEVCDGNAGILHSNSDHHWA